MSDANLNLLRKLLAARTSGEVKQVLVSIGDRPDVSLDQPFGDGFRWHAYGNNLSNLSSIGLGTKPGRSLTERLTNALDAVLEDRCPSGVALPDSPRIAAERWFGRPISGPDNGLYKWDYSESDSDKRVAVVLLPSGNENAPTVDIIDDGIGIAAEHFANTILSLHESNKMSKRYLIGAFGQGGSSTLAFSEYTLIVSRHRDDPNAVAFTVVRVLNVDNTYKEDIYAYLALASLAAANPVVLKCTIDSSITLYQADGVIKLPELAKGTLIRHFEYKMDGLVGSLAPSPGNLYHYLHAVMFDPLLPFRVFDLRKAGRAEIVTGSRNRLMKLANKTQEGGEETGSEVRHYREMEYVVPSGDLDPSVGIEYWVVLNFRKGKSSHKDDLILRSRSNELYIDPSHPILGCLNGQNQGELTAQMLRDLGLALVSRHIVIHFDASKCKSSIRRQLFSTNREGFKDGPVLTSLLQVLKQMLEEDQNLLAIEKELTERIVQRESQSTNDEVKRQVTKLLIDAGFQLKKEGPAFSQGTSEPQTIPTLRPGKPVRPDPLPTLVFPEVSKFDIVSPSERCSIHRNDIEVILVETDADSEFDRRGMVAIRVVPPVLEVASKSPLRGGRIRWRLRANESANVNDKGNIIATITRIDGTQLTSQVPFEILPEREERTRESKGQVPPFDIVPINPDDYPQEWSLAWPQFSEDSPQDEIESVAYKPVRIAGGITVYYSTIFKPYWEQIEKLKQGSQSLLELFKTNYEVWIGYHAIIQENNKSVSGDSEAFDQFLERERTNVGRMQVKQALRLAALIQHSLKTDSSQ